MKKVTLILATISLTIFASCKDSEKETVTEKTIVVEQDAPPAPEPEENDGTSLSIGNDGVEFSTKDGDNKTEVDIDTKK